MPEVQTVGLIKLLPHQVDQNWDWIAPLIEKSLPPIVKASEHGMSNILIALLTEQGHCWAYYNKQGMPTAIVLTAPHVDPLSGTSSLLIYSLTALEGLQKDDFETGFRSLMRYAKSKGYKSIVAYTNLRSIVNTVKAVGGRADYIFIEKEV